MSEIKFTAKAYCKIILHAAKYPHCSINGVLLAKSSNISNNKEVEFVDAVPLFHISLNLTPMAEIALMQIDEFASARGLVIVGYYSASENIKDNSFDKAHNKIVDKIASNANNSYFVVLDQQKLNRFLENHSLRVALNIDGNLKACDSQNITLYPDTTLEACRNLLESNSFNNLVDFDNHLDDISLDWMNSKLNSEIEQFMSLYK